MRKHSVPLAQALTTNVTSYYKFYLFVIYCIVYVNEPSMGSKSK